MRSGAGRTQWGRRSRQGRYLGLVICAAGLFLLALGGGYYLYAIKAKAGLDGLVAGDSIHASQGASAPVAWEKPAPLDANLIPQQIELHPPDVQAVPAPSMPHSGESVFPVYLWYEPHPTVSPASERKSLTQDFQSADTMGIAKLGSLPVAERIFISSIDLDAQVEDLGVVDLGDSRAYETPKNLVGHIPTTANPGEMGNGWYFGHLESLIRGEGSVFRRLPDIPAYLTAGREVEVVLQAGNRQYLYRVTKTAVVHQDDLQIQGDDMSLITLVTCVPRFYYDHRLLVTAELVGVKLLAGT